MANKNAHVFLCRMRAAEIFKRFSKDILVLLIIRKPDNVCDRVVLEGRIPIVRRSRRQALTPLKSRDLHTSHVDHGEDGNKHVERAVRDTTCDKKDEHRRKEEKSRKE